MFLFQTSVLWDIKAEVAQRAHYQAAGSRLPAPARAQYEPPASELLCRILQRVRVLLLLVAFCVLMLGEP